MKKLNVLLTTRKTAFQKILHNAGWLITVPIVIKSDIIRAGLVIMFIAR